MLELSNGKSRRRIIGVPLRTYLLVNVNMYVLLRIHCSKSGDGLGATTRYMGLVVAKRGPSWRRSDDIRELEVFDLHTKLPSLRILTLNVHDSSRGSSSCTRFLK